MSDLVLFQPVRAWDRNGVFAPGAKAYFYEPSTETARTVYSDSELSVAHPSPLVADARGVFAAVYTSGPVRVKVYDASDVLLPGGDLDPAPTVAGESAAAESISFEATADIPVANVQAAIERVQANIQSANDAFDTNGIQVRTSAGAFTGRTITGTTDQVTVTNGDGVSGNPTIALSVASQGEAEAGTDATKVMTAQRVAQAIKARRLQILHVREEQAAGTNGGTFTSGAWQTRVLNTVKTNGITGAALASNQITLPAGIYDIRARAPAFKSQYTAAKLYNVTDTADALIGGPTFFPSAYNVGGDSVVMGRVSISAEKVFELQHRCTTTSSTDGFGTAANIGIAEVYSEVWIERVGDA